MGKKNPAAAQKAKEKRERKLLEAQIKQSKEKCDEGRAFLEPEGRAQPQYNKATALFDQAIELYSENADAFTFRANAYLELKQPEQAIEDYTKALSLNPTSVMALEGRAACYELLHQWDKAIADCTSITTIHPDNDHAYNMRGCCRLRKRAVGLRLKNAEFAAVVEDFSIAVRINENNFHAFANLGKVYEEHSQYKKAMEQYTKSLQIKDDYQYALFRRGCCAMSFVEETLKAAQKGKGAGKDATSLTVNEQLSAEEEGENRAKENTELLKQAIGDFSRVIGEEKEQKEKELTAIVYRGSCHQMAGEVAKAEEDYQFVKTAMQNPEASAPTSILDVIAIKMKALHPEPAH